MTDWAEEKAHELCDHEYAFDDPDILIYDIAAALREAMERQKKIDAEICLRIRKEADNVKPEFTKNALSYGCLACNKAILSQRDDTKGGL